MMEFSDALEISVTDATQRADLWSDFATEFLRLGLLAEAMRGPPELKAVVVRAARLCRDAMSDEIARAENRLEMFNGLVAEAGKKLACAGLETSEPSASD